MSIPRRGSILRSHRPDNAWPAFCRPLQGRVLREAVARGFQRLPRRPQEAEARQSAACDSNVTPPGKPGRFVSVAVTVAVAVNDQGRREVLGVAIGASEAETFWTEFLRAGARSARRPARDLRRPQGSEGRGDGSSAPHGSAAACTSPATCWPMPASRAGASSPPSSPPPSPRRTPTARRPSGARSPTSSGPRCPSWPFSWTKPSTTSSPT